MEKQNPTYSLKDIQSTFQKLVYASLVQREKQVLHLDLEEVIFIIQSPVKIFTNL